jgi:hypothetical protein
VRPIFFMSVQQAIFTPRTLLMGSGTVHIAFFDVAYRIAAITLCLTLGRQVWYGLVERKITSFNTHTDILDWPLDWSRWSRQVFHRDTAPVRYWMEMGMQTSAVVLCLVAAIIGWWQPNT